jgi:NADH dehydrogenase
MLGSEVVRLARAAGQRVRAVVRDGADPARVAKLEQSGAELTTADLKEPATLVRACEGVTAVVSTATAVIPRLPGDSIATVDERGQLSLAQAAEDAGVERFVFASFHPVSLDFALQRAKRRVEDRLTRTGRYTILHAANFIEFWLSTAVGFDPVHGRAVLFGGGRQPVSWVSLHDVARFAVAATETDAFIGKTIELGGPDALSQRDVLDIFRQAGAPDVQVQDVPEAALEAQLAAATDAAAEAAAAITLATARGLLLDSRPALALLPGKLLTVRDYAIRLLGDTNG